MPEVLYLPAVMVGLQSQLLEVRVLCLQGDKPRAQVEQLQLELQTVRADREQLLSGQQAPSWCPISGGSQAANTAYPTQQQQQVHHLSFVYDPTWCDINCEQVKRI